jgi:uncharacterized protein YraI
MDLGTERPQHFGVRRKTLIHAAGLALLMALLACNVGAGGAPTPTATPTPEATEEATEEVTATATATEEVAEEPTVSTTEELNVRVGPDENCAKLGTYPANTEVKVLAKDPTGQWWQVPYNDEIGWMSAAYTTPATDLSSVQEIPGPACDPVPVAHTSTPTSTATSTSNPPTATATATATTGPYCGDGAVNGSEQCDGQAGSCGLGYTCNDSCQCEQLQIQLPVCGNNVKEGNEQCDGGGCGLGFTCNDSCQCEQLQIQLQVCGNGIKEGSEQCDGGGCGIGFTCSNSCTCQPLQISP